MIVPQVDEICLDAADDILFWNPQGRYELINIRILTKVHAFFQFERGDMFYVLPPFARLLL